MQDIFPLKCGKDHFPNSRAYIWEMVNDTSQPLLPSPPHVSMLWSLGSLAIILEVQVLSSWRLMYH